jgi:hypothetical protein
MPSSVSGSTVSRHSAVTSSTNKSPKKVPSVNNENSSASVNLAMAQQNNGNDVEFAPAEVTDDKKPHEAPISDIETATGSVSVTHQSATTTPKLPEVRQQGVSENFQHEAFLQLTQENKSLKVQLEAQQKSQQQQITHLSEQIKQLTEELRQKTNIQQQPQQQQQNMSYAQSAAAPMPYTPNVSMQQPYVEPIDLELFADHVKKSHGNIDAAEGNFFKELKHLYPASSNNAYRNSIAYMKQVRTKYCMQGFEHNMQQQMLAHHNYMTQVNYYNASQMHAIQQQCLMQMGVFGNNFGAAYPYQMVPPMMPNYMPPPQPTFYNPVPAATPESSAAKSEATIAASSIPKQKKQAILDMADDVKNAIDNMLEADKQKIENFSIQSLNEAYLDDEKEINALFEEKLFNNKNIFNNKQAKEYFINKIAQRCFPEQIETHETEAIHATKVLLEYALRKHEEAHHVHGPNCNHENHNDANTSQKLEEADIDDDIPEHLSDADKFDTPEHILTLEQKQQVAAAANDFIQEADDICAAILEDINIDDLSKLYLDNPEKIDEMLASGFEYQQAKDIFIDTMAKHYFADLLKTDAKKALDATKGLLVHYS